MNEIEITKIELDLMMRGCTERLQHEIEIGHLIGMAQIILMALLLWRLW